MCRHNSQTAQKFDAESRIVHVHDYMLDTFSCQKTVKMNRPHTKIVNFKRFGIQHPYMSVLGMKAIWLQLYENPNTSPRM